MTRASRADAPLFAALLALLAWLPVPWGSRGPGTAALLGVAAGVLLLCWAVLLARGRVAWPRLTSAARIALALGCAWLGWTALQLCPLPADWLARVSPGAHSVHTALATVDGARPLYTLSIAPGRTLDHLVLGFAYLSLYVLALVLTQSADRRRIVLIVVAVSAAGQGFYGALMTLSGLELGFLGAKASNLGRATGTFVNANHLAAYLNLGLAAGIGAILAERSGRGAPRPGWTARLAGWADIAFSTRFHLRLLLAIMVIALILTRSRMGNVAFFSALLACGGLYVLLRDRALLGRSLILFLSLLVIDTLLVSRWYGLERVVERIEQTDLGSEQRSAVMRELLPVAREYALTGAGLGSFPDAYAPFQPEPRSTRLDHAHNEYLELLVEVGMPGLALAALFALLHLAHALAVIAGRHRPAPAGVAFAALMGFALMAIQAAAEFQMRIPAIAGTALVLGAMAVNLRRSGRPEHDGRAQLG